MKKTTLLILFFMLLFFASCNLPEKVTEDMMRTMVAQTLQAKLNMIASQTPPSPTPTNTEPPTETPTPTITPTPTVEPTATWTMHERGKADVLVLYYHDVVKDKKDDPYYKKIADSWYVNPLDFEQQMRILKELNYTTITISQLVKVLYEGGELPERPVLITFDSTEQGQYKNAFRIMKKYNQVGNLFIKAGHVDAWGSLSAELIQEMVDYGWELGSNGYDYLGKGLGLSDRAFYGQEIGGSKAKIEELFPGVEVQAFSYPDGYTDPEGEIIRKTANTYKIAFSRMRGANDEMNINQAYFLPRKEINGDIHYNQFLTSILPWQEGSISPETMEWTIPTPTLDPKFVKQTRSAAETEMAAEE